MTTLNTNETINIIKTANTRNQNKLDNANAIARKPKQAGTHANQLNFARRNSSYVMMYRMKYNNMSSCSIFGA